MKSIKSYKDGERYILVMEGGTQKETETLINTVCSAFLSGKAPEYKIVENLESVGKQDEKKEKERIQQKIDQNIPAGFLEIEKALNSYDCAQKNGQLEIAQASQERYKALLRTLKAHPFIGSANKAKNIMLNCPKFFRKEIQELRRSNGMIEINSILQNIPDDQMTLYFSNVLNQKTAMV